MNNELNIPAVEAYAARFAAALCDQFFAQHAHISGKQIVEISPVRQVNNFVVKDIFVSWQQEAERLQHPYFDYSVLDVRRALSALMNLLSKNISIARPDFEPLLVKATRDTLVLLLDPYQYYHDLFYAFEEKRIEVEKHITPLTKYLRLHPELTTRIMAGLNEKGEEIKRKKAIKIAFEACEQKGLLEPAQPYLDAFASVLPVKPDDFWQNWGTEAGLEREFEVEVEDTPESLEEAFEPGDLIAFEKAPVAPVAASADQAAIAQTEQGGPIAMHDDYEAEMSGFECESAFDDDDYHDWFVGGADQDLEYFYQPEQEVQVQVLAKLDDHLEHESAFEEEDAHNFFDGAADELDYYALDMTDGVNPLAYQGLSDSGYVPMSGYESGEYTDTYGAADEESSIEWTQPAAVTAPAAPPQPEATPTPEPPARPNRLFAPDVEEEESPVTGSFYNQLIGGQPAASPFGERKASVQKISQLRGSIPLNLKFKFQNELFGGQHTAFSEAIDRIDQCKDYHQAIGMIKESYMRQFHWDMKSETTQEFLAFVDRRF